MNMMSDPDVVKQITTHLSEVETQLAETEQELAEAKHLYKDETTLHAPSVLSRNRIIGHCARIGRERESWHRQVNDWKESYHKTVEVCQAEKRAIQLWCASSSLPYKEW
jgi:hypothetical protein